MVPPWTDIFRRKRPPDDSPRPDPPDVAGESLSPADSGEPAASPGVADTLQPPQASTGPERDPSAAVPDGAWAAPLAATEAGPADGEAVPAAVADAAIEVRPAVHAPAPPSAPPPTSTAVLDTPPGPSTLTMDGRNYAIASLPEETRALVDLIRRADALMGIKREALQQLRWGRQAIARDLVQRLQTVEPLPEPGPSLSSDVNGDQT